MENLSKGKFYGNSKKEFHINGLTIVDSEFYHYTNCPWHYHQNAHFAFTTRGNLTETHKSKRIQLSAGCLIYNHTQEAHYNSDYSPAVSALHIDIDESWFQKYTVNQVAFEGFHEINDPLLKNYFFNILKEVKQFDNASGLTIESLIVQAITGLGKIAYVHSSATPVWVKKIKDLLYDRFDEKITLGEIAFSVNLHPVYLCQQFPVYFQCSFGEYLRKIRIEKAFGLMLASEKILLTNIAYSCGFSDQSHFTRLFKKQTGLTPLAFRKTINDK